MTKMVNIPTGAAAELEVVRQAVARRIRTLRKARGWSMDELCRRSGIAKGVLVETERVAANPSVATLCKLAGAFEVSVAAIVATETVSEPGLGGGTVLWQGEAGGRGVLLVGTTGPDMYELWRWRLMPGESHNAEAHAPGTIELIHVESGILTFSAECTKSRLEPGQSVAVKTDRGHAYANEASTELVFTMAVFEPRRSGAGS